jgi:hypothetical protein
MLKKLGVKSQFKVKGIELKQKIFVTAFKKVDELHKTLIYRAFGKKKAGTQGTSFFLHRLQVYCKLIGRLVTTPSVTVVLTVLVWQPAEPGAGTTVTV